MADGRFRLDSNKRCLMDYDKPLLHKLSQFSKVLCGSGWDRIALAQETFVLGALFHAKRCNAESMS